MSDCDKAFTQPSNTSNHKTLTPAVAKYIINKYGDSLYLFFGNDDRHGDSLHPGAGCCENDSASA